MARRDGVQRAAVSSSPSPAGAAALVSVRTIALVGAASFGASLAGVVPMVFSLAVRVTEIAPGSERMYGYVVGLGQLVTLVGAPLTGVLSDRCRSRWGRRRPFTLLGAVIGLAALPILATATSLAALAFGWVMTAFGWGTVGASVGNLLADRLPRGQRGSVSAVANVAGQIAPVVGVVLAGRFASDSWLLFLIPGLVGGGLVVLFIAFVHEDPATGREPQARLSPGSIASSYVFDPRAFPEFAWAWLGRFVFFFGLSLTSSFTTYFYAQRLDVPVVDIAPTLAVLSAAGVVAATLGSSLSGWASDRWGSRHGWTAMGALVFGAGAVVTFAASDLVLLAVGGVISAIGLAVFGTVGGALTMDILPERATQAGRFLGINAFSQKVPAALAPVVAPSLLLVTGDTPDYGFLYAVAAGCAVLGAAIIGSRAAPSATEHRLEPSAQIGDHVDDE